MFDTRHSFLKVLGVVKLLVFNKLFLRLVKMATDDYEILIMRMLDMI